MTEEKFEKCQYCGKKPENQNIPICKQCFEEADRNSINQMIDAFHEGLKKRGMRQERERIKVVINAFKTKNSNIIGTKIYNDILEAIDPMIIGIDFAQGKDKSIVNGKIVEREL